VIFINNLILIVRNAQLEYNLTVTSNAEIQQTACQWLVKGSSGHWTYDQL